MANRITSIQKGILGALIILLPICYLVATEITSAVQWQFYPDSSEKVTNLTKSGFLWSVSYYQQDTLIKRVKETLPFPGYGKLPAGTTRMVIEGTLTPPSASRTDLALHVGRIFANRYSVTIANQLPLTNGDLGFHTNIPLPNAAQIPIMFDLDISGISEPGFDLRSQFLVGNRMQLDKVSAAIQEKDHSLVLWLVIPRLVVGLLFTLGSLIFAYGIEFQLFGLFSLLSGIATATAYGEMGFYQPDVIDQGTLVNSLNLASSAVLLVFLNYFFRHRSRWPKRVAYALLGVALANIFIIKMWSISAESFVYMYHFSNFILQAICLYGAVIGTQAYRFLKSTKRSFPRQLICLILVAVFTTAIPMLSYIATSSDIFWLGGPLFELSFILVVAACVSTDIGGVRAERDIIRRKLGMFVDEGKVQDIISTRDATQEWRENVSVMFIDIRNFCVMNEVFGSHAIFDAVNDYYQEVIRTVYEHGGIVDKFIGDGVLAVWGISEQKTSPQLQCIRAAMALRQRFQELNAKRRALGKFPFSAGIGIHTGRVTYGLVGTDERAEFTVIGSTVNIAARIEKQTKRVQSDILFSEDFYHLIEKNVIVCPRGSMNAAGDEFSTDVYQPIALIDGSTLIINDPAFEKLALKPKAGVLTNAPPNLLTYDYKDFVGKADPRYRKAGDF